MKPSLTPQAPRLSELPGNVFRDALGQLLCANCSNAHQLELWREHDHHDRPECRCVVLCSSCSKKLIGPHPRLYYKLMRGEMVPGSLSVCANCTHQKNLGCDIGMHLTTLNFKPEPASAFVDGRKFHRLVVMAMKPITECQGKEPCKSV